MDKGNYRKEGGSMSASMGIILNVKGKTAKKILDNLHKPNVNKALFEQCAKMAEKLKEK